MWDEVFNGTGDTAEQARSDLEKIATFAEFKRSGQELDFERDFYPAIMRALFKSESWLAVVMITDLLARKYRFNVPGVSATSNWTRRMQRSISQLRSSPTERKRMESIRVLLEATGRL
jgi:4-alpha-glucanotransferase